MIDSERVKETILWCRQRMAMGGVLADSLRSPELKSADIIMRDVSRDVMSKEQIEMERERVVRELGQKRGALLGETIALTSKLEGGRILAFELEATFYDGVASEVSDGFFDDEDLPPWDTWISYGLFPKLGTNVLFSWVPDEVEAAVERAVLAHFADAYSWVDPDRIGA